MDEVLAFIYTGPCKPTKMDLGSGPLLWHAMYESCQV